MSVVPQHIPAHPKTLQIKDCGFLNQIFILKDKRMAIIILKAEDKITIYMVVFKYITHLYFFKRKKFGCSCNQS